MSYDIYLLDPVTKETIEFDFEHQIKGGTYAVGGTSRAWLNVAYNYSSIFYKVLGEKGIRTIYGLTGAEALPLLNEAIGKLKDDVHPDYWTATEGNAKRALYGLRSFATLRPDGVFNGD